MEKGDNLKAYALDCLCAIFLVDIKSKESFDFAKRLFHLMFNELKLQNINILFLINKIDLGEEKSLVNEKMKEFEKDKKGQFDRLNISIKGKKNIDQFFNKVYQYLNKNDLFTSVKWLVKGKNEVKNNITNYKGTINIILVGDSGVGKSQLFLRFLRDEFIEEFLNTIGTDRQIITIKYNDDYFRIALNDTAGQERFRSIPVKYFQNADGALILYDVSSKKSFQNINLWLKDLSGYEHSQKIIYLIGNKIDLSDRVISYEEGEKLAELLKIKYFEISCKINVNINEIFSRLVYECIQKFKTVQENLVLNPYTKKKKKCCKTD
jgi:small GTP-binding protein